MSLNDTQLENTKIPNTNYTLMDYAHGRCHIFAQALYEELGYEMEFMWDTDFWFNHNDYPSTVLVHAYGVTPNQLYIDSRGLITKEDMEAEYEYNESMYEITSIKQLNEMYRINMVEKPSKKELTAVRKYIQNNISHYQI